MNDINIKDVHSSQMRECVSIGKKDISLVQYYEDKGRYADLINGYFFRGSQMVDKKDITELDSRAVGVKNDNGRKEKQFSQVYRDMIRKIIFGVNFVMIALENQDEIHYAMPIRILYEDALAYHRRMKKIQNRHKKQKDCKSGAEFLGKFSKEDRVPAVISLVIYYGKEPWDGARDLYELFDLSMIPKEIRAFINHYPIHILEVRRFEHTEWFQTDLREVFEFIQCADDKEKLKEFVEMRRDRLADMAEDACDVIAAIAKTTALSFKEAQYRNEEGGINMCKALEDWGKELEEIGLQRGQQQGIQQGIQQGMRLTSAALFQYGMSVEEFATKFDIAIELVRLWHEEWERSEFVALSP